MIKSFSYRIVGTRFVCSRVREDTPERGPNDTAELHEASTQDDIVTESNLCEQQ